MEQKAKVQLGVLVTVKREKCREPERKAKRSLTVGGTRGGRRYEFRDVLTP